MDEPTHAVTTLTTDPRIKDRDPLTGDSAASTASPAPSSRGEWLFQNRRWIHPFFIVAAVVTGGGERPGRVAGLALLLLCLGVRLWAGRHLGGASRVHARKARQRKRLIISGPFAWVRNPLYVSNSLGIAGACLLLGPAWLGVVAGVSSFAWYRAIITWEESVNLGLYGDAYRVYMREVPRLLPRPPQRATEQLPPSGLHPWVKVLRRERGALVSVAVVITARVLQELLA